MSIKSRHPLTTSRQGHSWLTVTLAMLLAEGLLLLLSGLAHGITDTAPAPGEGEGTDAAPAEVASQQFPAPELDGGTAWLNSAGPIRLADLRGRIVLLDFWTLCCINCIHTLPDLAKLEAKYPGILVVLGIHSPKFPNEKETESIRKAILRYEIAHPVINDADLILWRRFRVQSWPTLVLIDPDGNVVWSDGGEGHYEVLDRMIGQLAKTYRAKKTLNEKPIRFELAKFTETGESPLFFPGKVLADQKSNRLFIADSTHHRIVITDLEGKKIAVAGTGTSGKKDGAFDQATFSDPQGMALNGEILYVADRRNHLIRQLDLAKQTVTTIAGTGEQNRFQRAQGGAARKIGLNSPWISCSTKKLYIAMAGHHQVWVLDLAKGRVDPFAGNGAEEIRDGPAFSASFAQPSGLATDGNTLYVADSETSAIRAIAITGFGNVTTLVGQGLFEFGDVNGTGDKVRLQHALGVAFRDGKLYVADTYNSKIKIINPADRSCTTFVGEPEGKKSSGTFNEPGGLSFAGDKLYVADTNGHRVRVIDMATKEVTTLSLQGVEAPKLPQPKEK